MVTLKNILLLFVIACLFAVLVQACSDHDTQRRLNEAELKMDQAPDSALQILESIDQDKLTSEGDRPLFGMLYTQALDKNHLEPQNDSLASRAAAYFERKRNKLYQVISTYYLGRTYYNKGDFAPALVNFFKAREVAIDNEYNFWAGMACRGIADIYGQTYNRSDGLTFAKEEYEYIKKSGKQPYLNWALLDLCDAECKSRNIDKSDSIAIQILDSTKIYSDPMRVMRNSPWMA